MTELMRLKEWQIFSRVFNCDTVGSYHGWHCIGSNSTQTDFVDKTTFTVTFNSSSYAVASILFNL